jgi:dihydroxy-acid dehydratase
LRSGDRLRIDLGKGTVDMMLEDAELAARRAALVRDGGYPTPESQTPWQAIYRDTVQQLGDGAGIKGVERFRRLHQTRGLPRDSH